MDDKLKQMIGEAIDEGFTDSTLIARKIRVHNNIRISSEQVEEFLQSQYREEVELKKLQDRFRGYDGRYYF